MRTIMKRVLAAALMAAIALPVLIIKGCGSDWNDDTAPITLRLASDASAPQDTPVLLPPGVLYIDFSITAPDMAPVARVVNTGGVGPVQESFNVYPGAQRLFTVRAIDRQGQAIWNGSARSDIGDEPMGVTVMMEFLMANDLVAPAPPGGLNVTKGVANTISLEWDESTDNSLVVAGYYIYEVMSNSPDPSYLVLRDSVQDTSVDITVSEPGGYCYQVSAIDPAGNESGLSAQDCATIGTGPFSPRNPNCPEFLTYHENPGNHYKWHPDSHPPKCYGDLPAPKTWWKKKH